MIATRSHRITQVLERAGGIKVVIWRRRSWATVSLGPIRYHLSSLQNLNIEFSAFQLLLLQQSFQSGRDFAGTRTDVANDGKDNLIGRGIETHSFSWLAIFLPGSSPLGGFSSHCICLRIVCVPPNCRNYQYLKTESAC